MNGNQGPPTSPGPRVARGVYVHMPFCVFRCGYCDFNAYSGMDELMSPYLDALLAQIRAEADGGRVDTIFFGGGTPTRSPTPHLARILEAIRDGFDVVPGAEVTVEANPESVDARVFEQLLAAGFNRVSLGVQSTASHVLKSLGRVHDAQTATDALKGAVDAGFGRVSADLIFGTPGETTEDLERSIDDVLAARVDHVSAYALTIEEGTPFAAMVERGRMPSPDEDDQADRYELCMDRLERAGLQQYEISNWSGPGSWCAHNLGYWRGDDYLAFGAGAHGHREGRRYWILRSPQAFIARSPDVEADHEIIPADGRVEEAAILGLRMVGGLDRALFAKRWGVDPAHRWAQEFTALAAGGLVEVTDRYIRPTKRAMFLSSEIARSLLSTPLRSGAI
ncbi:MAG TPA: radical SAM family heme chaperone HemW [Actinomycetota bacterium]|nr:radical SAM family heme chaperone HemW [Actinomycetota bacterium]